MCGRYSTAADRVKFDDIFKPAAVEQAVEKAVGRYNVAPTQQVAIIERTAEDDRRASTARWSLVPRWAKSIKERPQWINPRSDKVLTSKLWRSLAARPEGRILIPADGWYEWTHAEQQRNGPKPAPFHHQVDDGGWFAFAGLQSRGHRFDSGRRL
jgi:putative SOS response-associated peptidase YedK